MIAVPTLVGAQNQSANVTGIYGIVGRVMIMNNIWTRMNNLDYSRFWWNYNGAAHIKKGLVGL